MGPEGTQGCLGGPGWGSGGGRRAGQASRSEAVKSDEGRQGQQPGEQLAQAKHALKRTGKCDLSGSVDS